jgi:hypothetical protein
MNAHTHIDVPRLNGCVLLCVAPMHVESAWRVVEPLIRAAFESGIGDDDADVVHEDLVVQRSLLWVVVDEAKDEIIAAATTKLVMINRRKICVITSCAGRELMRWIGFIRNLEDYAKGEGCSIFRMMGRPGWARFFRRYGYRQPWIAIERRLECLD